MSVAAPRIPLERFLSLRAMPNGVSDLRRFHGASTASRISPTASIPARFITHGHVIEYQLWMHSRASGSLLTAGSALLLLTAFAPKANALVEIAYFNFEDATSGGAPDMAADVVGAPDSNPGGGIKASTLQTNFDPGDFFAIGGLGGINRTALDIDTTANVGLGFSTTPADNGHWIQFGVNTTNISGMSLSFAVASTSSPTASGFTSVAFSVSTDGVNFLPVASHSILLSVPQILSVPLPPFLNGQPNVFLRLAFDGGSMGFLTQIDNIQLTATAVPEPTTVAGGLLGVLGLIWLQRRRLIGFARLRSQTPQRSSRR